MELAVVEPATVEAVVALAVAAVVDPKNKESLNQGSCRGGVNSGDK